MKYCIFTFIFNNYEPIREPEEIDSNADYVLFTDDKNLKSENWKIIYIPEFDTDQLSGVQKTFQIKYHFYKYLDNYQQYDYFISIDSSIKIYKSLEPIVNYIDKYQYDLSIAPHSERQNFLDEYIAWTNCRENSINYLINFFSNTTDFDYKNILGLCETTLKIYKNNKVILNFLDDIYSILNHLCNFDDKNDQCYFTYILYKYLDKLRVNYHPVTLYRYSDYMKTFNHGLNLPTHHSPIEYQKSMKFLNRYISVNDVKDYTKF